MSPGAGELALLIAALLAAAGALVGPQRSRPVAAWAALVLAPTLIAVENWDSTRFEELRDDPALLAAALAATALGVALLVAVFRRWPLALPLTAVAALPVRVPVELGGDTSHLLLPLYLVVVAGLASQGSQLSRFRPEGAWRWVVWALAVMLLLYGIQASYGPGFSQAAENVGFFFVPFAVLFALLASLEWDRRMLITALTVVVAEGLVFTAVAIGQYSVGELWWNQKVIEGNQYHEWFRVNSLFWDPNIFGRYLAVAIALVSAVIAYAGNRRVAWLATATAVAMMIGLAASFSQSALLALLLGLVMVVLLRWGIRRTAAAIGACAAIATAALLITGTPDLGEERLEAETSGRSGLIRGGIELAEDAPIAGHGSGSFAREFRRSFAGDRRVAVSSHTEPVTIAAEQGAIGLLPYLALLAATALAFATGPAGQAAFRGDGWLRVGAVGVGAAFAVMVAHSIGYAAFLSDPITWALLAVAISLSRQSGAGEPRSAGPAA